MMKGFWSRSPWMCKLGALNTIRRRISEFGLNTCTADGGDRTHTHLRELDFESSASASSATSAFLRRELVIGLRRNARIKERERIRAQCSRFRSMAKLVSEGKIRFVGLSEFRLSQ